jgi:hypothetical protein
MSKWITFYSLMNGSIIPYNMLVRSKNHISASFQRKPTTKTSRDSGNRGLFIFLSNGYFTRINLVRATVPSSKVARIS